MYLFGGLPFSPLPTEGEGAAVRGKLPAKGTPHPAFGHRLPQGERVNGTSR